MNVTRIMLWVVLSYGVATVYGQSTEEEPLTEEGALTFETNKPLKLIEAIESEQDPIEVKKEKKRKPRVFYGLKTKKGFTRKGFRTKEIIEKFYYLKKSSLPNHFIRDIYWYDFSRQQVRKTTKFDPEKGVLLHGPYRKTRNKTLLEEGIFYKGTKHGRWMHYNTRGVLVGKEKYYKGWPKESLIRYYDPIEKTQVKEIIPIEHGERDGYYYYFHKNGVTAVFGEYKWGNRVGRWVENYTTGKLKRIILYPENPFDRKHKPFIKSEWDLTGKKRYSSRRSQ